MNCPSSDIIATRWNISAVCYILTEYARLQLYITRVRIMKSDMGTQVILIMMALYA
jgi:hypothetical protein